MTSSIANTRWTSILLLMLQRIDELLGDWGNTLLSTENCS